MMILLGVVLLFMYLGCMVAVVQFKGDTSIGNFTWGGGVMLVALYTFLVSLFFSRAAHVACRKILITTLIVLWALRLIFFVYMRYTGKDPRFKGWHWQGFKALVINICWIFGQIIMIAIMSYPAVLVNLNQVLPYALFTPSMPSTLTYLDILGLIIWLIGFWYEAISDYQLFKFMQQPENKGHVMKSGLWRYSRHPNYFGEILMWWGLFCIALCLPYGWTTIIAPVTITLLLLFVTGIPWNEKAMEQNPEYQEYKKKTSVFIPWFPKE